MFEKKKGMPHLTLKELPLLPAVHDDVQAVSHTLQRLRDQWKQEDVHLPRVRKPKKQLPRIQRPIRLELPEGLAEWNRRLAIVNAKLAQLHSTTIEDKLKHAHAELELIRQS